MNQPQQDKPSILGYAAPEYSQRQTGADATMASVAYPALALLAHALAHSYLRAGLKGHSGIAFVFVLSQFLPLAGIGCASYALHTSNPNRFLSWFGVMFGTLTTLTSLLAFVGI